MSKVAGAPSVGFLILYFAFRGIIHFNNTVDSGCLETNGR